MERLELTKAQKILNRLKHLEDIRKPTLDTCKDITDFIAPRYGKYLTLGEASEQRKKEKHEKIINGTALRSLRVLKAGMQTGLTNPARPWFRLGFEDEELAEFGPVRTWLGQVERKMLAVFDNSNFYEATHITYGHLGAFGTGCLFLQEDYEDFIRCRWPTMGEYVLAVDSTGRVNTVGRRFYMTARQAYELWGEKCSKQIKDFMRTNSAHDKKVQIVHWVQPNKDRDVKKSDSRNMPYSSTYLEYDNHEKDDLLQESGFEEFPYLCPVWEVQDTEEYGSSPCMDILGDVKMLQQIESTALKALHKVIDPPMIAPPEFKGRFKNMPGSVNFGNVREQQVGPLYQINYDLNAAELKIQNIEHKVKEGLFNDLFMMIASMEGTQPLTATEVLERKEEKMTMLGPVVDRVIKRMLRPCIDRTFNILYRRQALPPPPPEIQGRDLKVEFISLLAQAQKMVSVQGLQATVNYAASLEQLRPGTFDVIDADQSVQEYGDAVGAPFNVIRSDDKIAEIRAARAQEQQAMQQQEQLMQMAEGAKTVSEIDTEGKNALTDLMGGAGG